MFSRFRRKKKEKKSKQNEKNNQNLKEKSKNDSINKTEEKNTEKSNIYGGISQFSNNNNNSINSINEGRSHRRAQSFSYKRGLIPQIKTPIFSQTLEDIEIKIKEKEKEKEKEQNSNENSIKTFPIISLFLTNIHKLFQNEILNEIQEKPDDFYSKIEKNITEIKEDEELKSFIKFWLLKKKEEILEILKSKPIETKTSFLIINLMIFFEENKGKIPQLNQINDSETNDSKINGPILPPRPKNPNWRISVPGLKIN